MAPHDLKHQADKLVQLVVTFKTRPASLGERFDLGSAQRARVDPEALDAAIERRMPPVAAQEGNLIAHPTWRQQDVSLPSMKRLTS